MNCISYKYLFIRLSHLTIKFAFVSERSLCKPQPKQVNGLHNHMRTVLLRAEWAVMPAHGQMSCDGNTSRHPEPLLIQ